FQRIHRHACEGEGHHAINEVGTAGAQIVSQIAHYGLFARGPLDLIAQIFGDAHFLAMAECIGFSIFLHLVALPFWAFRENNKRVVAWVVALVLDEQLDQVLSSTLYSGMQQRTVVTYAV